MWFIEFKETSGQLYLPGMAYGLIIGLLSLQESNPSPLLGLENHTCFSLYLENLALKLTSGGSGETQDQGISTLVVR